VTIRRRRLLLGFLLAAAALAAPRAAWTSCCGCTIGDGMSEPCPVGGRICFDDVSNDECFPLCQSFGCYSDWTLAATCGTGTFYANCEVFNPTTPTPIIPTPTPVPRDCCECTGCVETDDDDGPFDFCDKVGSQTECEARCAADNCAGAEFVVGNRCDGETDTCQPYQNSAVPASAPLTAIAIAAGLLLIGVWSVRRRVLR
jgi:hypothetical protein